MEEKELVEDGLQNPSTSLVQQESFRPRIASGLLQRIIDDSFQRSVRNYSYDPAIEKKYKELTKYLQKGSDEFERNAEQRELFRSESRSGRTREILQNLSPRYNDKYQALLYRFEKWKPKRETTIQILSNNISQLDWHFKISTIVRFVASSVDVSGSVGGTIFRSESGWENHALNVASFCGLCGLVSTVAEVERSKRILDEVTELIEKDHKLLMPIVSWFEETEELDSVVQDLFPHGIDKDIVQEIQEASEEQDDYLKVFKAALLSNVRRDTALLDNRDFLHSLQLFARSEVAPLWWNRIIYRKHPIVLDFSRMALQIEFGQMQSIIFQCIPALPLEQQRLASLPVAGRIMLNLLTMYDSFMDLRKGAKSTHSDKLRRQVEQMAEELKIIEDTIRMMKPRGE